MIVTHIIRKLKISQKSLGVIYPKKDFNNFNLINTYSFKSFSENFQKHHRIFKETNLKGYINYIRKHGFKSAKIDPLELSQTNIPEKEYFSAEAWELGELEKVEEFPIDNSAAFTKTLLDKNITISELESYLNKLYLNQVGVEFEHIDSEDEKAWLYENYESLMTAEENNMELVNAFKILYPADLFEKFLSNKFPTFKRYSGEGANTLLILLYSLLSECSKKESEVSSAILSMPHRGRLNILPMVMDYPVANLLTKIQGKRDMPAEIEGIDDVVSHVATTNQKTYCLDGSIKDYKPISVSLLHNPSHLEAIYPVSMGKTYAKGQDNKNLDSVMNITIHGDAAVSGQGVIYESLSFHRSPNCNLNGTVHIVTNNQIGYTTQGEFSRSSLHCTDIFKSYSIPIIHVNADDTQSLIKIGKLAYLYKLKFKKDIVVNLVCWRKYGHNEVDEPMFTQPIMYKKIKSKIESVEILKNHLLSKNLITEENIKTLEERYSKILNDELKRSQTLELKLDEVRNEKFKGNKAFTHKWKEMDFPQFCKPDNEIKTGLNSTDDVKNILKASATLPENFKIHPRLNQYFVNNRLGMLEKGIIDWPSAEMAAFGSLLKEGYNVRISGQDVTRGTFSQRHIGLFDQETNNVYFPFKDSKNFDSQGRLEVNNSSLSEFAVMLFEYGYSLESPKNCVIWEAQFGDFVNGAQVIIYNNFFYI
jgi:probable 2-oxoglutarate dehydrogenase E1 component DHKTD1